jgi:hypothetical protein
VSPLPFVKAHWRPIAAGLALVVAFGAGRYTTPTKVVTHTEEDVVFRDSVVDKHLAVNGEEAHRERVVYRDRTVVTHSDGSAEHRDVEWTDTSADKKKLTVDATEHTEARASESIKVADKTVTTDAPKWFVGAELGVPISLSSGVGTPFVVGHVDHHVLGPVSAGIWGSLDIHGANPAFGLGVGVALP